jgi:hypothetical protein
LDRLYDRFHRQSIFRSCHGVRTGCAQGRSRSGNSPGTPSSRKGVSPFRGTPRYSDAAADSREESVEAVAEFFAHTRGEAQERLRALREAGRGTPAGGAPLARSKQGRQHGDARRTSHAGRPATPAQDSTTAAQDAATSSQDPATSVREAAQLRSVYGERRKSPTEPETERNNW